MKSDPWFVLRPQRYWVATPCRLLHSLSSQLHLAVLAVIPENFRRVTYGGNLVRWSQAYHVIVSQKDQHSELETERSNRRLHLHTEPPQPIRHAFAVGGGSLGSDAPFSAVCLGCFR